MLYVLREWWFVSRVFSEQRSNSSLSSNHCLSSCKLRENHPWRKKSPNSSLRNHTYSANVRNKNAANSWFSRKHSTHWLITKASSCLVISIDYSNFIAFHSPNSHQMHPRVNSINISRIASNHLSLNICLICKLPRPQKLFIEMFQPRPLIIKIF